MDEKTEDLRDIFMEVADDETVTEEQEETHGSLSSDQSVDERLSEVISSMKEDLDFSTTLSVDELVTIVR
ncbi:MAG: conditioned medium-induced protein 4, partial [Halobacteriaceae archaeon]